MMCRGIVEDTEKPSAMMEKYSSASKMAPQSSGSLRSNAGIEKGKEIAARLNIHRIHSQLRGLDSSGTHTQIYIHMFIYYTLLENTLIGQLSTYCPKKKIIFV